MRLRRALALVAASSLIACGLSAIGTGETADAGADGDTAPVRSKDSAAPDACASCPSGFECTAGVCSDEARRHFTQAGNPDGNWTWAYRARPDAATLPYAVTHTESTNAGIIAWSTSDASLTPSVFFNPDATAVNVFNKSVTMGPFGLAFHPGPNDENSVVRWTAPRAGTYRATVDLRGLSGGNGSLHTTSTATVARGDTILAVTLIGGDGGPNSDDAGARKLALGALNFYAGDVLDVRLGYGANGNYFSDTTGVDVTITTP